MSATSRSSPGPATPDDSPRRTDEAARLPAVPPVSGGARRSRLRRTAEALLAVGPFAAVLTAYGLIFDNVPDQWFKYLAIKYLFSGVAALAVGLVLRIAAQRFTPLAAEGGPQAGEPALRQQNPLSCSASPYALLAETAAALEADFREGQHEGAAIWGWSQYIGDVVPPSPIGTSYGLRLAMVLDIRSHQINYSRIASSLVALQRPGGGWAASTQRGFARPEVTAWVLPAALRAGLDHSTGIKLIRLLEGMTEAADPVALNRTSVVTSIVAALAEIAPQSPRLPVLARLLRASAQTAADQRSAYWGERLNEPSVGSVPHTARAVVALKKAARVLAGAADLNSTANAAINWLSRDSTELADTDEQLRRPVDGGVVDALFIGHFTAAWTVRAFMCADDGSVKADVLQRAMASVLAKQERGIWYWHDGSLPIWMTYQGASVIRDYILRGLTWPP